MKFNVTTLPTDPDAPAAPYAIHMEWQPEDGDTRQVDISGWALNAPNLYKPRQTAIEDAIDQLETAKQVLREQLE